MIVRDEWLINTYKAKIGAFHACTVDVGAVLLIIHEKVNSPFLMAIFSRDLNVILN